MVEQLRRASRMRGCDKARKVASEGAEMRVWGLGVDRSGCHLECVETVAVRKKTMRSQMGSSLGCWAEEFGFVSAGLGRPFAVKPGKLLQRRGFLHIEAWSSGQVENRKGYFRQKALPEDKAWPGLGEMVGEDSRHRRTDNGRHQGRQDA